MDNKLKIGVIADDFTGASDAASFLKKGGLSTLLLNGIPSSNINLDGISAVVIALKTRTMQREKAVELSLKGIKWFMRNNTKQLYSKYCSTFNSTNEGNIGPIIDAILDRYDYPYTIIAPSLPSNGRIVKNGHLYVHGIPLNESSMKDHPLTPMWDSKISNLMSMQGKYGSIELGKDSLYLDNIKDLISSYINKGEKFYIIPDYIDDRDGHNIATMFKNLPFLTGGSGLLEFMAEQYTQEHNIDDNFSEKIVKGKSIVLAGSVSQSTQSQVKYFIETHKPSFKINPYYIFEENFFSQITEFITNNQNDDILIYSSDTPEKIKEYQKMGKERTAKKIEGIFAKVSKTALKIGYSKIIIAGGETSGSVIQALKFDSFMMGRNIAPGVPIIAPTDNRSIRLVLKSGNFGEENFFIKAINLMEGCNGY